MEKKMDGVLQRRELGHLQAWYAGANHKPLIIRGARQVGKSTLVCQFVSLSGHHLLELNFERNPEYREAFSVSDSVQILSTLAPFTGIELEPDKVILLLSKTLRQPLHRVG